MTNTIDKKLQERNRAVQNLYRARHLLEGLTTAGAGEADSYYKAAKGLVDVHTKILADIDGETVAKMPLEFVALEVGDSVEGRLKKDFEKGYTFLEVKGSKDVFLHISAVPEEMQDALKMGDTVQFVVGENEKGICANVQLPPIKEAKSRKLKRPSKKTNASENAAPVEGLDGHSGWKPIFEALESLTGGSPGESVPA